MHRSKAATRCSSHRSRDRSWCRARRSSSSLNMRAPRGRARRRQRRGCICERMAFVGDTPKSHRQPTTGARLRRSTPAHDVRMRESLEVRLARTSRVVVVDVRGELDAGTCTPVVDAIDAATLFDGDVVVVDTTALTFVDSGGRRALDHACRRANAVFVPGPAVERFDRCSPTALLRGDGVVGLRLRGRRTGRLTRRSRLGRWCR